MMTVRNGQRDHAIADLASEILTSVGDRLLSARFLDQGSDNRVWDIEGEKDRYALRILVGRTTARRSRVETAVRRDLFDGGALVAEPLLSSSDKGAPRGGAGWVLDRYLHGNHPGRGRLTARTCRQLGQFLVRLHALPVSGWGRPLTLNGGMPKGREKEALAGLLDRFDRPLPLDEADWNLHPLSAERDLSSHAVLAATNRILERMQRCAPVLCHSDLHEKRILVRDGRLSGVIDFDDMAVLDHRWDLASFHYFHGHACLKHMLTGYGGNGDLLAEARLFSIGIALHHGSRSRLPGRAHRREVAANHIRRELSVVKKSL